MKYILISPNTIVPINLSLEIIMVVSGKLAKTAIIKSINA
jgi:hypothetical protein